MYAKAAEPALQEDKRADRGFTATTGTQTKSRPVIGDIVITAYNNKHWLSSPCALCSRSQMAPAPWHLRCLQDGVCATGASATLARKFWALGLPVTMLCRPFTNTLKSLCFQTRKNSKTSGLHFVRLRVQF